MNKIYNTLKTKRKYTRKPLCGHIEGGFCSYDICRMNYAVKIPKNKIPPLDETFKHRDKVIKTIRRKQLQELDSEIDIPELNTSYGCTLTYPGEYSKQKQRQARYEKYCWIALWVLCGLILLAGILI